MTCNGGGEVSSHPMAGYLLKSGVKGTSVTTMKGRWMPR